MENLIDMQASWRKQTVLEEALTLAGTGDYHDYTDIEYALICRHGWPEVRDLLNSGPLRLRLNIRCGEAREQMVTMRDG